MTRSRAVAGEEGRSVYAALSLVFALALALSSVAKGADRPPATSPAPGVPWPIPSGLAVAPSPRLTPSFAGRTATLAETVDWALDNAPATRAAWRRARAVANVKGIREAAFWPNLDLDLNFSRSQTAASGGAVQTLLSSWGPAATLTWLLLDLGGRSADVGESNSLLFAANLAQDAAIQGTVLVVEVAFFNVGASRELALAAETSLAEASQSLAVANGRHEAGLATIADVLQARTARSQAELALESARGRLETARGQLAASLGLPANFPIDTAPLPPDLGGMEDEGPAGAKVETLIETALAARPDLLAARQVAEAAQARVRSVRSSALPRVTGIASYGRPYYLDSPVASFSDTWSVGVNVHVPIFSGFARTHDLARAKEEAEAFRADAESAATRAALDAWTAFWDLRTARHRLASAHDLLQAASASAEVAAGRYKEGVGSFLDLLTAQTALASARAQEVGARADGLASIARLAYATGALGPLPLPKEEASAGSPK